MGSVRRRLLTFDSCLHLVLPDISIIPPLFVYTLAFSLHLGGEKFLTCLLTSKQIGRCRYSVIFSACSELHLFQHVL